MDTNQSVETLEVSQNNTNTIQPIPPKKKDNKGLIIFLILIILGMGGYITYDKALKDKIFTKEETKKIEKKENIENNNKVEVKDNNKVQNISVKEYNIGDAVIFNNENWHVIKKSISSDDYVVLLKDSEIPELNNKPYYDCPKEDDNGLNCSMKMSNDYQKSVAKKYFDSTYINVLGKNNLKEVNGYYVRLITLNELVSLGCSKSDESCANAPKWLIGDTVSWTMSYSIPSQTNGDVYSFGYDNYVEESTLTELGVGSTLSVRPVINLLKTAIK